MQANFFCFLLLFFCSSAGFGQSKTAPITASVPISIQWKKQLSGDYSFSQNWSYPLGIALQENGKAGCGDGGFCSPRCYNMLDSNGIVHPDSAVVYYSLIDTTRTFHGISCEAWCYEWAGTDIIRVGRQNADTVSAYTQTGIATHCSLHLQIVGDTCIARIVLRSIRKGGAANFYCTDGEIAMDKKSWSEGVLKAEFHFNFDHWEDPSRPMFWKGRIYAPIQQ